MADLISDLQKLAGLYPITSWQWRTLDAAVAAEQMRHRAEVRLAEHLHGVPIGTPQLQYLDDRITALATEYRALVKQVDDLKKSQYLVDLKKSQYLDKFAKDIKRERLGAYGLGVVSDMSTDSLLAELKRRAGD